MSIRFENLFTEAGMLARCILDEGERIASAQDFLELITNSPAPTIVLDRKDLAPAFFELRSGLAGECLQKISNYRRRLAVLGDFSAVSSSALRDFIYESNTTGKVIFVDRLERAVELLR